MWYVILLSWAILLGLPLYGLRAGTGALFFTGIYVTLSGLLVKILGPALMSLTHGDSVAVGLTQLIAFLVLSIMAFPLANITNRLVMISFDPFDWVLGAVFGIITAIVAVHFFLGFFITYTKTTPEHKELNQTFLVRQVVYFDGWNNLVEYVTTLDAPEKHDTLRQGNDW